MQYLHSQLNLARDQDQHLELQDLSAFTVIRIQAHTPTINMDHHLLLQLIRIRMRLGRRHISSNSKLTNKRQDIHRHQHIRRRRHIHQLQHIRLRPFTLNRLLYHLHQHLQSTPLVLVSSVHTQLARQILDTTHRDKANPAEVILLVNLLDALQLCLEHTPSPKSRQNLTLTPVLSTLKKRTKGTADLVRETAGSCPRLLRGDLLSSDSMPRHLQSQLDHHGICCIAIFDLKII